MPTGSDAFADGPRSAPPDLELADDEALADRARARSEADEGPALRVESSLLPTLRVFPFGISRKRLEQAIRELQLPVIVARELDEADIAMTLRSEYRQKGPVYGRPRTGRCPSTSSRRTLSRCSERDLDLSLEVDPRGRPARDGGGDRLVVRQSQAVELAPQNAYIRRLQHQLAERANLVSRSRGREPYRRVRLYPDEARAWR